MPTTLIQTTGLLAMLGAVIYAIGDVLMLAFAPGVSCCAGA